MDVHGENHPVPFKLLAYDSNLICLTQHLFHNRFFIQWTKWSFTVFLHIVSSMETANSRTTFGHRERLCLWGLVGSRHQPFSQSFAMEVLANRSSREPRCGADCAFLRFCKVKDDGLERHNSATSSWWSGEYSMHSNVFEHAIDDPGRNSEDCPVHNQLRLQILSVGFFLYASKPHGR